MIVISRSKKASNKKSQKNQEKYIKNNEHETRKTKTYKDPDLCQVEGCENFRMETSDVCEECYLRISNEMSQTVTKDDCQPLKLDGNQSYKSFMQLLENKDE